ncbi:MAG: ATP synthase F0 subunit C [Planctomycetes bacterium]|nr:ATP synthase F0 subunit C [Planctomycetota bacterium]
MKDIANMAAFLGAGFAVGLGAIGSGWGIGNAVVGAARGMAKQPSRNFALFRSMLINQAFGSNASIFALVIGILLWLKGGSKLDAPDSLAQAAAYLSAGLSIGIGALGSGIGSGLVAQDSLEAIARCPKAESRVSLMMFIAQAWCQTPCVFAFVVSILLMYVVGNNFNVLTDEQNIVAAGRALGMGICMGAGAIGPAIGIAFVGAKACQGATNSPEHLQNIRNSFFVGAAVSESTTVYALVISLLMMGGFAD